ncbi:MAG TPA: hypothetical protein DHV48_18590 [Prolixibacteraceae bacterium]|nr:hypothetical protein [Prolixibacteraceae bacterium]
MEYRIEELNIDDRLEELDLKLPVGLSFFPENFETAKKKGDFIFTESMVDLNKLFRQSNISFEAFGGDTELYRSRKNADIYLPAIFLSFSLISENPNFISVSLNILSSYVYDRLRGSFGKNTAQVEFYIETKEKGKVKKISFKGDSEAIKNFENILKALK